MADLATRVWQLRTLIRHHKSAIAARRRALQADAAELRRLEGECWQRGITLVTTTTTRVGEALHGDHPNQSDSESPVQSRHDHPPGVHHGQRPAV